MKIDEKKEYLKAVVNGDLAVVDFYIKRRSVDIDSVDERGRSALMLAYLQKDKKIFEYLYS